MQVKVNTSNGLENKESLERWADAEIRQNLHRFGDDVTRVEIYLSNENHDASRGGDKRCLMEARLAHHAPLVATQHAADMDAAFRGASDKLRRLLDSKLGRQGDHRDRSTIRSAEDTPDSAP